MTQVLQPDSILRGKDCWRFFLGEDYSEVRFNLQVLEHQVVDLQVLEQQRTDFWTSRHGVNNVISRFLEFRKKE